MKAALFCACLLTVVSGFLPTRAAAELFYTDFEYPRYHAGEIFTGSPQAESELPGCVSRISPPGLGYRGGQSLMISRGADGQGCLAMNIPWIEENNVAYIDFMIRPSVSTEGADADLWLNGSQVAFQARDGAGNADVWAFAGDQANLSPWMRIPALIPLNWKDRTAVGYCRITVRQDFDNGVWDLYLDGKRVAENLQLEGFADRHFELRFYASDSGDVFIDNLSVRGEKTAPRMPNGMFPYDLREIDAFTDMYMRYFAEGYVGAGESGGAAKTEVRKVGVSKRRKVTAAAAVSAEFQVFTPLLSVP